MPKRRPLKADDRALMRALTENVSRWLIEFERALGIDNEPRGNWARVYAKDTAAARRLVRKAWRRIKEL